MEDQSDAGRPPQYVQAEVVQRGAPQPPSQRFVLEQPRSLFGSLGRIACTLLLVALMISLFGNLGQQVAYQSYFVTTEGAYEKYHSLSKTATDKVAIVLLEGTIIEGDGFVKRQIDLVRADENVKAIVLRINSPGGTVTGSSYLYHHFKELAKEREIPMVISMGSLCASGGYYVAMAVGDEKDVLFAEPATWTGSIGVVIPHYDISGLLDSWHVKDDSMRSHKYKQLLSPTRSWGDKDSEERALVQALVDDSFNEFKDVVRSGRPALRNDNAKLDEIATGQIFSANQALEHGLIDKIGFIEAAIDRAIELAKLSKDEVRVVKYKRRLPGLVETLAGESGATQFGGIDVGQLLDMTAPRAYYLSTWLPAVLSNSTP